MCSSRVPDSNYLNLNFSFVHHHLPSNMYTLRNAHRRLPLTTRHQLLRRRRYHADALPSLISTSSPEFVAKAEAMDGLVADLETKLASARLGGGEKARQRMKGKGKLLPRER
jgi:3-methylcrotonyl-CoA carboxylase beta subunit